MKKRQDLKNELDKELNYLKILKREKQMEIKLEELEYEKKKFNFHIILDVKLIFCMKNLMRYQLKLKMKLISPSFVFK